MSKHGVFSGPYFSVFGLEKTPYLDTFHAVLFHIFFILLFLCNAIFSFSFKHSEHLLLLVLYAWCLPKISQVMLAPRLLSFIFQISFDSSVSDLRFLSLWLSDFKCCFINTVVNFGSGFSPNRVMFAWYKMLLLRHFCCRRQCGILMQLQVLLLLVGDWYGIFLLCAFIIDVIIGRQL